MAALCLLPLFPPVQPKKPETLSSSSTSSSSINTFISIENGTHKRGNRIFRSVSPPGASNPSNSESEKPQIELEFIAPKPGADASYPVERVSANSGEKLLRSIMLDNKIELYAAYGKVMNCGGGGTCGTCIVEIIDGKDLLNERTDTEKRYLKKKPETWRLACQTIVGNKENTGKVIVQRLPQWKK